MVEFYLRLGVAGGVLALAFGTGTLDMRFALCWAAAVAALGFLNDRLGARGVKNPGIAGFFAVGDAALIAMLLGASGQLATLGFLTLAPALVAVLRHGASPIGVAPLTAAVLLPVSGIYSPGTLGMPLLLQMLGVLALGLIPLRSVEDREEASPSVLDADGIAQMRERYRTLRDSYRDLERRARKDRLLAQLADLRAGQSEGFYQRLTLKLQGLLGADRLALYCVAEYAGALVIRAIQGDFPEVREEEALRIDLAQAPGQIRHAVDKVLASHGAGDLRRYANVLLTHRGRMLGALAIKEADPSKLHEICLLAEEVAPSLAAILAEELQREEHTRRLKEAELLYAISALGRGAATRADLGERVAQELAGSLRLDHVAIYTLENGDASPVAEIGEGPSLLEGMRFEKGHGVEGWLASGAGEVILPDARGEAVERGLRGGLGSFCLLPLMDGLETVGLITVGTQRVGGIDVPQVELLRGVSSELRQAFAPSTEQEGGFMTPQEFHRTLTGAKPGCLVVMELQRREALTERYGAEAVQRAMRRFGGRLRGNLAAGGALCRPKSGEFLAYLPTEDLERAMRWANEMTAQAAFVNLRHPETGARTPIGIRAKVAILKAGIAEIPQNLAA